jgi:hypothetical protein
VCLPTYCPIRLSGKQRRWADHRLSERAAQEKSKPIHNQTIAESLMDAAARSCGNLFAANGVKIIHCRTPQNTVSA